MLKRLFEPLGERSLILTIVGGSLGSHRRRWHPESLGTMVNGGLGRRIAASIAVPALSATFNRLGQARRTAAHAIKKVLNASAVAYGHPQRHVRANVMRVCPNRQCSARSGTHVQHGQRSRYLIWDRYFGRRHRRGLDTSHASVRRSHVGIAERWADMGAQSL